MTFNEYLIMEYGQDLDGIICDTSENDDDVELEIDRLRDEHENYCYDNDIEFED